MPRLTTKLENYIVNKQEHDGFKMQGYGNRNIKRSISVKFGILIYFNKWDKKAYVLWRWLHWTSPTVQPSIFCFRFKKIFFLSGGWWYPSTNSYKPSQILWEATLLRRSWSVQRLAKSLGTNRKNDKQPVWHYIILSLLILKLIVLVYFQEESFGSIQRNLESLDITGSFIHFAAYLHYNKSLFAGM